MTALTKSHNVCNWERRTVAASSDLAKHRRKNEFNKGIGNNPVRQNVRQNDHTKSIWKPRKPRKHCEGTARNYTLINSPEFQEHNESLRYASRAIIPNIKLRKAYRT